jgi:hypothetical protein
MKNDLPYFSHDNDARNHPKMKALRAQYGATGYGQFWMLNELISQAPEAHLDLVRKINRLAVAQELGFNLEELEKFLAFLSDPDIDLVYYVDGIIWTDRTEENYKSVKAERERKRGKYSEVATTPRSNDNSPGNNANNPERKDTKQSIANEEVIKEATCIHTEIEPAREEPAAAVEEPACLPVTFLEIAERIKTAPFPSHFSPKDIKAFSEKIADSRLGIGFISFCIKKSISARNPAGLLKKGLLQYDSWVEEFLWKPQSQNTYPTQGSKAPEAPLLNEVLNDENHHAFKVLADGLKAGGRVYESIKFAKNLIVPQESRLETVQ